MGPASSRVTEARPANWSPLSLLLQGCVHQSVTRPSDPAEQSTSYFKGYIRVPREKVPEAKFGAADEVVFGQRGCRGLGFE